MLDPDGQLAFVPGLADGAHWRNEHSLDQIDEASASLYQTAGACPHAGLVTFDESNVNSPGLAFEASAGGFRGPTGRESPTLGGLECVATDEVAAIHELGSKATALHPAIRSLVVDAESVGRRLEVELLVIAGLHIGQPSRAGIFATKVR